MLPKIHMIPDQILNGILCQDAFDASKLDRELAMRDVSCKQRGQSMGLQETSTRCS